MSSTDSLLTTKLYLPPKPPALVALLGEGLIRWLTLVSSPAIDEGVVYFGGLDGKLYAVSTAPEVYSPGVFA